MLRFVFPVLFVLLLDTRVLATTTELLTNPSFEDGTTGWKANGFTMEIDNSEVHGGTASIKCSGRTKVMQGPFQFVTLQKGRTYVYSSYIKLINDKQGKMYQTAKIMISIKLVDGSKTNLQIGTQKCISSMDGWAMIGGDFEVPDSESEIQSVKVFVSGLDPGVDFYYDDTSLTEVPDNPNWEAEANQRIEDIRKSNMRFEVTLPSDYDANDVTVEVKLKKHSFGWGALVSADHLLSPDFEQYRKMVFYMFDWATVSDYKWKMNKGNRTHPNYEKAVAATNLLRENGMKVRGHCMFWATEGHSPEWVEATKGEELKAAVEDRIAYMTDLTKNKLEHWDVNNEYLHGRLFEINSGDPTITQKMYKGVHDADPNTILFMNDFAVVRLGTYTQTYVSAVEQFKAAGVGLGGIGVQSHLPYYVEPNPTIMKLRLDTLATTGVPIWISELDFAAHDEETFAKWYENVLRLYFSHPGVNGITLFSFWDRHTDPLEALVNGYYFKLNKAGETFLRLTKEEWSTHHNQPLSEGSQFDLRGFQGDYDAIVWHKGKAIKKKSFTLGKGQKTIQIELTGSESEISIDQEENPFDGSYTIQTNPQVTSGKARKLGSTSSSSDSSTLQCETRKSAFDLTAANIQCEPGEVLTSCSSWVNDNTFRRNGEQVIIDNGVPVCRGINGFESTGEIQAIARCCSLKELECHYRKSGISGTGVDDRTEISCSGYGYPTGCSTFTTAFESDGSFITGTSCFAQNDNPKKGVSGYAACCQGGGLTCSTVISDPSGQLVGDNSKVSCPKGTTMTGCNVFTQYGRAAGAYIQKEGDADVCVAVNGGGKFDRETGVQAHATCCSV